jgi:hypothetical protein
LSWQEDHFVSGEDFQQSFATKAPGYVQIDKDLIQLLYHSDIQILLNEAGRWHSVGNSLKLM